MTAATVPAAIPSSRLRPIGAVRSTTMAAKTSSWCPPGSMCHRAQKCGGSTVMLNRLTLDQLRILMSVAELGSFSAAARKLNRAQSAVSQSIQSLEETLGLQLFDRSRKLPQLTNAGKAILVDAKRIIANADALRTRAKSIATVAEPEISLAIEQVFPNDVLIECLDSFRVKYPLVSATLFAE